MQKIDLLPCPFCGKLETLRMIYLPAEKCECVYHVVCDAVNGGCGASTGWNHETPEEAAKEWNIRASGWISYSERMPETTEKGLGVLYSDCLLVVSSKTGWTAMAYCITDGEKTWWEFADAQNKIKIDWDEVTHWMPLPETPQRKDDTNDND